MRAALKNESGSAKPVIKTAVRVRRTAFRTNVELRSMIAVAIARQGYSAKRRSQWICDAIERLAIENPTFDTVGNGDALDNYPELDSITLTATADRILEDARTIIRGVDPTAEGITAAVIRTAIRRAARAELAGERAPGENLKGHRK